MVVAVFSSVAKFELEQQLALCPAFRSHTTIGMETLVHLPSVLLPLVPMLVWMIHLRTTASVPVCHLRLQFLHSPYR